ncbi:Uncharacterized conserved protein YutE, UPF0331/DUF86 family [Mesobacillus persicus]|uniref:Uncharacterized conserved protein YutE, UPF0331/DUF86 family n=1 Tax=Mesobacillus persicus TaxID=930146 RepID=A0A1H7ZUK8_9BACI|nr:DUF86 domain-containing protein [Mesobacillus persicus]SEM61991.1 Uncharacterized conserved protein YutE, UPF0331/DUF86 family [Mesobacillus persicus]
MYFVDRDSIEETLIYLDKQIERFKSHPQWTTDIEKAALERLTHTMLEAILDVGNMMIDGFIMRDPGSYEDILDILLDEKVITSEMHQSLIHLIQFRKMTVQQYTRVDHESLENAFTKEVSVLQIFSSKVRDYITNELGPVSAFKK